MASLGRSQPTQFDEFFNRNHLSPLLLVFLLATIAHKQCPVISEHVLWTNVAFIFHYIFIYVSSFGGLDNLTQVFICIDAKVIVLEFWQYHHLCDSVTVFG